jgi:hypothetical protein
VDDAGLLPTQRGLLAAATAGLLTLSGGSFFWLFLAALSAGPFCWPFLVDLSDGPY